MSDTIPSTFPTHGQYATRVWARGDALRYDRGEEMMEGQNFLRARNCRRTKPSTFAAAGREGVGSYSPGAASSWVWGALEETTNSYVNFIWSVVRLPAKRRRLRLVVDLEQGQIRWRVRTVGGIWGAYTTHTAVTTRAISEGSQTLTAGTAYEVQVDMQAQVSQTCKVYVVQLVEDTAQSSDL